MNTITLRYVEEHSLQVGPITDLMGSKVTCIGLGNTYTRLLGYVVIWVQVDRVQGYDEDQIALIIPDFSNFTTRVPIILGTPTFGRVVKMMREAEMDTLATPWANARAAHLLAVRRMMPVEVGNDQEEGKKTPMARAISVLPVPEPPEPESLQVEDDTCSDLHTPKLMIRQRCSKLFDELDLSGLDTWAPELVEEACWLLAEYHDVFLLDLVELGCTHSTEHTIKVTDDTSFKE